MRKRFFIIGLLAFGLFMSGQALAHTPLCSCYDNGDGTITCEGGFSDGSSAAGVSMKVVDETGKVITVKDENGNDICLEGKMDEDSEFTFIKPETPYKAIFDAGPGHEVTVESEEITE